MNPDIWDEVLANNIARGQGLSELNELHWKVIVSLENTTCRWEKLLETMS